MSDPGTPAYDAALMQFQEESGVDIQQIRDRERWSLPAAKRRLTTTPKGQVTNQKDESRGQRPQRSRK